MSKTHEAILSVAQTQYLRSLRIGQSKSRAVLAEVLACQISDYAKIGSKQISESDAFWGIWLCGAMLAVLETRDTRGIRRI